MSGFQLFPMSKDVLPCRFAMCVFGGDASVSEESKIDEIVDVAACAGGRSLEEYILPLMIQALSGAWRVCVLRFDFIWRGG